MNRKLIKRTHSKEDFERVYRLMLDSFPFEELRSHDNHMKLADEPGYVMRVLTNTADEVDAFFSCWEFEAFTFGEHFAVRKELRGSGIGSELLRFVCEQSELPFVLEVELPENDIAKRRIAFYERGGFVYNDIEYYQPPLQTGAGIVPLRIMSYPGKLTENEFEKTSSELYKSVYHYSGTISDISKKRRNDAIAYCGLACFCCDENGCGSCKSGGCFDKDSCKNYRCCQERDYDGCWQCDSFPCDSKMFDSMRTRAFVRFIRKYGCLKLYDCLNNAQKAGLHYHFDGKLVGDFDACDSEDDVIKMLLFFDGVK